MMLKNEKQDVNMMHSVLKAFSRAQSPKNCEAWLSRMEEHGLKPNIGCYRLAIFCAVKNDDSRRAERLLEKVRSTITHPSGKDACYSALINKLAGKGDVGRAEAWLRTMHADGIEASVWTFNSVMNACTRKGDTERAEHWLGKMATYKVAPDVISYSTVIHGCVQDNDMARAERLFKQMEAAKIVPNKAIFHFMMNVSAKAGDLMRAESWFIKMTQASPVPFKADAQTYNIMIHACAMAKQASFAE